MRHQNPASIGAAEVTGLETTPEPGQGDFLARVNATISNFKELAKIFSQLRPQQPADREPPEPEGPPEATNPLIAHPPQGAAPGLADYMQMAIKAGYGDVPIGKLIEQISPHTLKQIMEIFSNVGPQK